MELVVCSIYLQGENRLIVSLKIIFILVCLLPWYMFLSDQTSEIIRWLYSGTCHQIPEHSIQTPSVSMLVCSRCSGAYIGAVLGILIPWKPTPFQRQQLIATACILTLLQLFIQFMFGIDHIQRLLSGGLLGFSVLLLANCAQSSQLNSR